MAAGGRGRNDGEADRRGEARAARVSAARVPAARVLSARVAAGRIAAVAALLALAACAAVTPPAQTPVQRSNALQAAPPPEPRASVPDSGRDSAALRTFYASVENQLIEGGRMRRDVAPADAPYGTDDLVRDFERLALYDEYVDLDGRFVHQETSATLRRWDKPVRVGVMSGASMTPEDAARDRANVAAFTNRLARLTGADMGMGAAADVNFLVLFMTNEERAAFADQIDANFPSFDPAVMASLRNTPLDNFCTTYSFMRPGDPTTYGAVIVAIRAEHPPFTRLSCVNEEMAQAMGLPNDSPEARPSIFNNSIEFALLTDHDAILLRMLYDPRLRPGMTADEARPLLPAIARDAQAAQAADGLGTVVATN